MVFLFIGFFSMGYFASNLQKESQLASVGSLIQSLNKTDIQPGLNQDSPWEKVNSPNGVFLNIGSEDLNNILGFCNRLESYIYNDDKEQVDIKRLFTYQGFDGKLYCVNSNGTASDTLCGNGTVNGCQQAGCCGGCPGGIFPSGVTDIFDLSEIIWVPNVVERFLEPIKEKE